MISEFRVPLMIFAGNSYTYYNDLPTIVSKLAEAAGEGYEFDSHLEVYISFVIRAFLVHPDQMSLAL